MESNYIKKIKEKGLLKVISRSISFRIGFCFYKLFTKFPLKNIVVFESVGDYTDNAQALYKYMEENGYFSKYIPVWVAVKPKELRQKYNFRTIPAQRFSIRKAYYLAVAKYYLFDHDDVTPFGMKRKDQVKVYFSHGYGIKKIKANRLLCDVSDVDYIVVGGQIPAEHANLDWGGKPEQVVQWGLPRNDYLFKKNPRIEEKIEQKYHFSAYKKVFLWMPTFRQCDINKELSEDYLQSETGLPLFATYSELENFSKFMADNNSLLVLKVHPLQAHLDVFKKKYSNIIIVKNTDLQNMDIQLYEFIPKSDCLITDYSSVANDYMLIDKPIIYILDDYKEFDNERGMKKGKYGIDSFAGDFVYNLDELKEAISKIIQGKDSYCDKRHQVVKEMYKYPDGHTCERVLRELNI